MDETISVVIPVYNRAKWIGRTLEHVFNQSVLVDEIVICDDGSTDDLESALKPFEDIIKLVRIENSGPAIARKIAIDNSTGYWVALCDSDDFWEPDHIKNFRKAVESFSDLDLYFSDFILSDDLECSKFAQAPENWLEELASARSATGGHYYRCREPFLTALLRFQGCFQSCMVFRKRFYDDIGGIMDYVSRWPSEDFHLTARMAAKGKGVVSLRPSVLINKHENNFSGDYIKNLKGELDVLNDLKFRRLVPVASLRLIDSRVEIYHLRLFRACYWHGEYVEALRFWRLLTLVNCGPRDFFRFLISQFFSFTRK